MKKCLATFTLCGLTLSAFTMTASAAAKDQVSTNGDIGFTANANPPAIVDPNPDPNPDADPDPDPTPLPGEDGPLRFDTLPTLNFGTDNTLSAAAQTYYANFDSKSHTAGSEQGLYPTYFSVTDVRGGTQGWSVTIYNNGIFTNVNDSTDKIAGYITFKQASIESATFDKLANASMFPSITTGEIPVSTSSAVTLAAAVHGNNGSGQGYGKWSVGYGDTSVKTTGFGVDGNALSGTGTPDATKVDRNPAVRLEVPSQMINTNVTYTTDLIWSLNNTL